MENVKEFGAHLYFSPVCPLSGQGEPPGEVHHVELRIRRSGKIFPTTFSSHQSSIFLQFLTEE